MTKEIMCEECNTVSAVWHVGLEDNNESVLFVCEACLKTLPATLSFWETMEAYLESKALCTLQDKLIEANRLDQEFDWDHAQGPFPQYDTSYLHSQALAEFLNGGGSLEDARRIGNESACGVDALINNGYLFNAANDVWYVLSQGSAK